MINKINTYLFFLFVQCSLHGASLQPQSVIQKIPQKNSSEITDVGIRATSERSLYQAIFGTQKQFFTLQDVQNFVKQAEATFTKTVDHMFAENIRYIKTLSYASYQQYLVKLHTNLEGQQRDLDKLNQKTTLAVGYDLNTAFERIGELDDGQCNAFYPLAKEAYNIKINMEVSKRSIEFTSSLFEQTKQQIIAESNALFVSKSIDQIQGEMIPQIDTEINRLSTVTKEKLQEFYQLQAMCGQCNRTSLRFQHQLQEVRKYETLLAREKIKLDLANQAIKAQQEKKIAALKIEQQKLQELQKAGLLYAHDEPLLEALDRSIQEKVQTQLMHPKFTPAALALLRDNNAAIKEYESFRANALQNYMLEAACSEFNQLAQEATTLTHKEFRPLFNETAKDYIKIFDTIKTGAPSEIIQAHKELIVLNKIKDTLVSLSKGIGHGALGTIAVQTLSVLIPTLTPLLKAKAIADLSIMGVTAAQAFLKDPLGALDTFTTMLKSFQQLTLDQKAEHIGYFVGSFFAPDVKTVVKNIGNTQDKIHKILKVPIADHAKTVTTTTDKVLSDVERKVAGESSAISLQQKVTLQQYWESLMKDPAHGNKITLKSIDEAVAGIVAEQGGKLKGPLVRDISKAAEFIDKNKTPWDVKMAISRTEDGKYIFRPDKLLASIKRELLIGENIILDIRKLEKADYQKLLSETLSKLSPDDIKKILVVGYKDDLIKQ